MTTPAPSGAACAKVEQAHRGVSAEMTEGPLAADPAVVDLLGVLAYGELTAFFRLTADAGRAPTLADQIELGRLAAAEFAHFELLRTRLEQWGIDPVAAMEPFREAVDAFHARTTPSSWIESLVKAHVGDRLASDFYREISAWSRPDVCELVREVLSDCGQAGFVERAVHQAVEQDPRIAGRLALWARRLVAEALGQAQRIVAERQALAGLLLGTAEGSDSDLSQFVRAVGQVTASHTRRMAALGLAP